MRWRRVEVTGGFLLLAAVLFYLDTQGLLLWGVLACVIHELGHYGAIYALGGRIVQLRLSISGAEMVLSAASPMSNVRQFLSALAGPAANLIAALMLSRLVQPLSAPWDLFTGLNLSLALFNLLPIAQLDGGRAMEYLLRAAISPLTAQRTMTILSFLTVNGLLAAGLWLFWRSRGNFTLLLMALWLTMALARGDWPGSGKRKKREGQGWVLLF